MFYVNLLDLDLDSRLMFIDCLKSLSLTLLFRSVNAKSKYCHIYAVIANYYCKNFKYNISYE